MNRDAKIWLGAAGVAAAVVTGLLLVERRAAAAPGASSAPTQAQPGSGSGNVPGSGNSTQPSDPLVPPPANVLLVGDSLAVGLGTEFRAVATSSGYAASVDAKGGTNMQQWAARIGASLAQRQPALVLVSLGTNDAAMANPTSQEEQAALNSILAQAQAAGAVVVWIGPPTLPTLPRAESVRQMIRSTGVLYFPSEQIEFERTSDKIHATGAGYAAWMDAIWDWMGRSYLVATVTAAP